MRGFDRVEHLADVVVAGDALNLKEGAGIVAAGGLGQGALKTQEEGHCVKKTAKAESAMSSMG